jgi:transposase
LRKHKEITLYHLPTYSPEYNPVEKIWWWIKPKVYGLFAFKNGLKELLKRFRNLVTAYNKNELISPLELKLDIFKKTISFIAD